MLTQIEIDQIVNASREAEEGPTAIVRRVEAAVMDGLDAADAESRRMFVARLERMQQDGDQWLTTTAVLALLNDCDMLAAKLKPYQSIEVRKGVVYVVDRRVPELQPDGRTVILDRVTVERYTPYGSEIR